MKEFLNKYEKQIKIIKPIIIIAFFVAFLEFLVFNFRHWQFAGNKEAILVDNYIMSDNVTAVDTNTFMVDSCESRPYVEIKDLDLPINLVYFDFINVNQGEFGVCEINYQIELTDKGNAIPYQCPERTFMRLVQKTHYTTLNPYGNVHSLRLYFNNLNEGDTVRIAALSLNPKYEMLVSKKRMLVLFIVLLLLWVIRPNSEIYGFSVEDSFKWKKWAIICVCVVEIIVFFKAAHVNKYYDHLEPGGQTQFQQLAEAIVDRGEVFLSAKPQDGLIAMEDPYDAILRNSNEFEVSDVGDMSDTGFYKDRFFVYFGIAPILLFYVPFYAITGTHIATRTVFCLIAILNCIGAFLLLYEISIRFFRKLSFVIYLIFSVLASFGAGQMFLARTPDFYSVPIFFALSCIMVGMGCWIKALNDEKAEETLHCGWLLTGSLLMAMPAASRPQFLIASFLAVVLFWKSVFKDRTLFSIKSIRQSISFVLPYVLVAIGIMYYNYIRFGNVFDLGANYNLCYNNMPYRGWHIDRLLHPLIGYLFYPCTVTNVFPYFEFSSYISRYTGITADENLFGGVIYNNLYLIFAFLTVKYRKYIRDKAAFGIAVLSTIFAVIVGIVDANMAGTLPRYYADFTWGYMLAAFIVLGSLYAAVGGETDVDNYKQCKRQEIIRVIVYLSFVVSIIRWFLMMFAGPAAKNGNILLFNTVKNLVEFWN